MTPKEKALELCKSFHNAPANDELIDGINWQMARECALIAVKEIIDAMEVYGYSGTFYDDQETGEMVCNDKKSPVNYWNQVKTEIEKL